MSSVRERFLLDENLRRIAHEVTRQVPGATEYLHAQLYTMAKRYAEFINREITSSDPFPGVTVDDQLRYYNGQFVAVLISHVISNRSNGTPSGIPDVQYASTEINAPATMYKRCANDLLRAWTDRPSVNRTSRDDGLDITATMHRTEINPMIDYTVSTEGYNHHYESFETAAMKRFNKDSAYLTTPYGVSTPAADARLLSRYGARANTTNTIPNREIRLYRRHFDRNIDEAIRPADQLNTSWKTSGYDMSGLRAATDRIGQAKRDRPCGLRGYAAFI